MHFFKFLSLLCSLLLLFVVCGFAAAKPSEGVDIGSIWVIGDSITQGNADGDKNDTYRSMLHRLLAEDGIVHSFTGHHTANPEGLPTTGKAPLDNLYQYHSGVSGHMIGEPESGKIPGIFEKADRLWATGRLAVEKPDNVLILLGTNDVGRGYKIGTAPDRLSALIEKIYAFPGAGDPQVFVGTIPPNRREEAQRTNVMLYNETLGLMVAKWREMGKSVHLVDHHTALDAEFDAAMRSDKLHAARRGNEIIAAGWHRALTEVHAGGAEDVARTTLPSAFPGEVSDFHGYPLHTFRQENVAIQVIAPKNPGEGKPWLWRSMFWTAIKRVWQADLQLVDEGYHVVIVHGHVHGHPDGNKNIDVAYNYLTKEHGFAPKCSMYAMSRGNLSLFRWANANPEKVESIISDNGVANILSWPGGGVVPGNDSIGNGAPDSWEALKKHFGYNSDEQALKSKESPIYMLEPLAEHKVPILVIGGLNDIAVPYEENDQLMLDNYRALGGSIEAISHGRGHSHGLPDPTPVLKFIRSHRAE